MTQFVLSTQENVQTWLFSTSREVLDMFESIHHTNGRLRQFDPKRCAISTMTIIGTLSKAVSVSEIREREDDLIDGGLVVEHKRGSFMNQITVKSGNASIKLFRNGTVQCTGSQSVVAFVECMDRLCEVLDATLEDARIAMMNINFHCRRSIPLRALQETLGFAYDPDMNFCGARLDQGDAKTTAYATGNIIISGASPKALSTAYGNVCTQLDRVFETHPNMKKDPLIKTKAQIDSYMIQHGYSSRLTTFDLT